MSHSAATMSVSRQRNAARLSKLRWFVRPGARGFGESRMQVQLKIWTPDGEVIETQIEDQEDLVRELRAVGQKYCCRASDLDYQVGDGIRVTGDSTARNRIIELEDLTPPDDEPA